MHMVWWETLEIKCPCCHIGESVTGAASKDSKFCLQLNSDGLLHLQAYVQTQTFVSEVKYCDLCVCTFNGDDYGIHTEHIF